MELAVTNNVHLLTDNRSIKLSISVDCHIGIRRVDEALKGGISIYMGISATVVKNAQTCRQSVVAYAITVYMNRCGAGSALELQCSILVQKHQQFMRYFCDS